MNLHPGVGLTTRKRTWLHNLTFPSLVLILHGVFSLHAMSESVMAGSTNQAEFTLVAAPALPAAGTYRIWPSEPPPGCPFPVSETIRGISFTGRHAEYTGADTWYPSWASDDALYSPWTDGSVNGVGISSAGEDAATGHATILGNDPMHLVVTNQGTFKSSPRPYEGRYPCGSLVHDGVWYYGTYCLHPSGRVDKDGIPYNWPWLGPFVGFRWSTDFGKTWTQTRCTPEKPLFGESALKGEPVKIGSPHFVDFGKAMQYSPDGKAYLVAHGASDGVNRRFAFNSWITGDQIYLVRVTPSIANMNDASKYEYYAGNDAKGQAAWSKDFARIQPIASWKDNMGCVTMTWNPGLKRYLLCVTDGGNTVSWFNTYILESENLTGPWRMAAYFKHFGEQAYFVNVPSKFQSTDGRTLWLCYAANFSSGWGGVNFYSRPAGSRYGMCLQEVRLLGPGDQVAQPTVLESPENVARYARISTSSVHPDYAAEGAVDGLVGGYPGDIKQEWCTQSEGSSAIYRLTWTRPETIDRIWLFDRPNTIDQIKSGLLVFSDGTTIRTGELPDQAEKGLEVRFPPKTVRWVTFLVDEVKPGAANIGLSEIAVFRTKTTPR